MNRVLTALTVAVVATVACGGETPAAKSPEAAPSTKTDDTAKKEDTKSASTADAKKPVTAVPPPPSAPNASVPVGASPESHPDLDSNSKGPYDRALRSLQSGDLAGAREALFEATNKSPNSATAHHALGSVLERAGDVPGAQSQYRKAIAGNPSYEPAIYALAMSLARNGRATEADALVTEKHASYPNSVAIATTRAEVDPGCAQAPSGLRPRDGRDCARLLSGAKVRRSALCPPRDS
jgi:TolA-binding protein